MKLDRMANAALALSFFVMLAQAQTPSAAQDHISRGSSLYEKGDLNGAIAEFTKAIEISSRPDNHGRADDWKNKTGIGDVAMNFDKVRVLELCRNS